MKQILLSSSLMLLAFAGKAQTKKDYETAMHQFQNYYNRHQSDSICYICIAPDAREKDPQLSKQAMDDMMKQYGAIKSFEYVDEPQKDGVVLFKTNFSGATRLFGISLNKSKKIVSFKVLDK